MYKAQEDPLLVPCALGPYLYGTAFSASAMAAGKYPVFAAQEPACYPLCQVMIPLRLIDTLTVVKALSVREPVSPVRSSAGLKISICEGKNFVEGIVAGSGTAARYSPRP